MQPDRPTPSPSGIEQPPPFAGGPSSTAAPALAPSGIAPVDAHWGGLARGGTYLFVGPARQGRLDLTTRAVRGAVDAGEAALVFSPREPQALVEEATAAGLDLSAAYARGLVRLLRVPPAADLVALGDEGLRHALGELTEALGAHRPARVAFDDFTPFVQFRTFDAFAGALGDLIGAVASLGTTLVFGLGEPANDGSRRLLDYVQREVAGTLHLRRAGEGAAGQLTLVGGTTHRGEPYVTAWPPQQAPAAPRRSLFTETPLAPAAPPPDPVGAAPAVADAPPRPEPGHPTSAPSAGDGMAAPPLVPASFVVTASPAESASGDPFGTLATPAPEPEPFESPEAASFGPDSEEEAAPAPSAASFGLDPFEAAPVAADAPDFAQAAPPEPAPAEATSFETAPTEAAPFEADAFEEAAFEPVAAVADGGLEEATFQPVAPGEPGPEDPFALSFGPDPLAAGHLVDSDVDGAAALDAPPEPYDPIPAGDGLHGAALAVHAAAYPEVYAAPIAAPTPAAPAPFDEPVAMPSGTPMAEPSAPFGFDADPEVAFRGDLAGAFAQRGARSFLVVALRAEVGGPYFGAFPAVADGVLAALGADDRALVRDEEARLIALLPGAAEDAPARLFAAVKVHLATIFGDEADAALKAVGALVVPDGQPFTSADELFQYAMG